jgi:hypothetical protein
MSSSAGPASGLHEPETDHYTNQPPADSGNPEEHEERHFVASRPERVADSKIGDERPPTTNVFWPQRKTAENLRPYTG